MYSKYTQPTNNILAFAIAAQKAKQKLSLTSLSLYTIKFTNNCFGISFFVIKFLAFGDGWRIQMK